MVLPAPDELPLLLVELELVADEPKPLYTADDPEAPPCVADAVPEAVVVAFILVGFCAPQGWFSVHAAAQALLFIPQFLTH